MFEGLEQLLLGELSILTKSEKEVGGYNLQGHLFKYLLEIEQNAYVYISFPEPQRRYNFW